MWGELASVGGSLLSGLFGASSSRSAARAQQRAVDAGIDEMRRQYDKSREDVAPWMAAGRNALARLQELTGEGGQLVQPFDFTEDPGYQFGLNEGLDAINANMAARGMRKSGAANKALARYAQDYAGTKYNEAFNRDLASKNALYNMYAGLSGSGQASAQQVASMGANTGNAIAGMMGQSGNAAAAGRVGTANALINSMGQVGDYYRMKELLK